MMKDSQDMIKVIQLFLQSILSNRLKRMRSCKLVQQIYCDIVKCDMNYCSQLLRFRQTADWLLLMLTFTLVSTQLSDSTGLCPHCSVFTAGNPAEEKG